MRIDRISEDCCTTIPGASEVKLEPGSQSKDKHRKFAVKLGRTERCHEAHPMGSAGWLGLGLTEHSMA